MSKAQLSSCILFFMCLLCAGHGQVIDHVDEANVGKFPYMALVEAIYEKNRNFYKPTWEGICGGTILGHYWVLSAEHCLMSTKFVDAHTGEPGERHPERFRVMVGSVNKNDKSGRREVAAWYYPGDYQQYHHDENAGNTFPVNDILLFRLKRKLQLVKKKIWPAKLPGPNQDLQVNDEVIFHGWGIKNENFESSDTLLYGTSDVIEQYYCRYFLNDVYSFDRLQKIERMLRYLKRKTQEDEFLESSQVCVGQKHVGDRARSAPFTGDSGSGLFRKKDKEWIVYGVMSFSVKNGTPEIAGQVQGPAVFNRVSFYRDWIIRKMIYDPYSNGTVIDPFFQEYYREELEASLEEE